MKNQKVLVPNYYENFKCISGACEDTCCSKWNVFVDESTYNLYQNIDNEDLSLLFKNHIHRNKYSKNSSDYAIIDTNENGDCIFLSESKLCNIYSTLGEKQLCTTCKTHPRNFNYVDNVIEKSLSLSCPEACRKILFNENPIEFLSDKEYIKEITIHGSLETSDHTNKLNKYFYDIRIFTIKVLQTKELTIEERLGCLGLFFDEINNNTEINIADTIIAYENKIKDGYFNNFLYDNLNSDNSTKMQLMFVLRSCSKLLNKISSPGYFNNFVYIVNGLNLDGSSGYEVLKSTYLNSKESIYNSFMSENSSVYENYLVNYVYKTLFPKTDMSLFEIYTNLFLNFAILRFNIIGLCSHFGAEMSREKLVSLVSNFVRMSEHTEGISKILNTFAIENNFNTIEDILLIIGF